MKWVLLVVVFCGDGMTSTTINFKTEQACLDAKKVFLTNLEMEARDTGRRPFLYCALINEEK